VGVMGDIAIGMADRDRQWLSPSGTVSTGGAGPGLTGNTSRAGDPGPGPGRAEAPPNIQRKMPGTG
jgi:hypothetical protein